MRILPYALGCQPSSVPAETLLQDGWNAFLLFFAVSTQVNTEGHVTDLGVAVVECGGCRLTKFGYPNDEGIVEHPLFGEGLLSGNSSIFEVLDSSWANEVAQQMEGARKRLWSADTLRKVDPVHLRHFVITLKETTFECLSDGLRVDRYFKTFEEAQAFVLSRMDNH